MSNVVQLWPHQRNDPVKALEILLELARSDRLRGAIISCSHDRGSGVYVFGEYERSPLLAARELKRMQQQIPDLSGESRTLEADSK